MATTRGQKKHVVEPFAPAPLCAVSAEGVPRFEGYEGIVATTGLSGLSGDFTLGGSGPLGMVRRRIRQKSWVYLVAATPEIAVTSALMNGGITGLGFLMITDLQTGEVIADTSRKGALASVNDAPGDGLRAAYRLPGTRYAVRRDGDVTRFRASVGRSIASLPGQSKPWIEVDLTLTESGEGITAISEVEHGQESSVSVTGKTSGLAVVGDVAVHGEQGARGFSLGGGIGGYDYTQGLLPRNTAWRWAYGTGRLADGTVLGFNLSEGFSGVGERSRENAVWIDGRPTPLDARTRFVFERADVMQPWRVSTQDATVRLRFDPVAAHNEFLDVKAVRSLFIQPVGHFSGEIDVDGRTYVLDQVPGVVEDSEILW
jgi:Domain of unknown function (DUF2804), C-terminal/Domain of unknown function (DUF2804), N-terminal